MQSVSALYETIYAGEHTTEYRMTINGHVYSQSEIYGEPKISGALFDDFSLGNTVSRNLVCDIVPSGTIPKMASIAVECRVKNATQTSEWLKKGTYYIDTRKTNADGIMHIEAYDAMLKAGYVFMKSGTWTSQTARQLADTVAADMGISVSTETRTMMDGEPKTIGFIPIIGEDGTTAQELLSDIAVMYAGNWIVDDTNKLRLIQLAKVASGFLIDESANYITVGGYRIDVN